MNREDFRLLYLYNDWANDRLLGMLEAAFGPNADMWNVDAIGVRRIQETTIHIVAAQLDFGLF